MTEAEMAQSGFTPEDFEGDDVEVWPENWLSWRLFCDMSTQWRYTAAGGGMSPSIPVRTGLNYPSLYPLLDRACPTPEEWERHFQDVRVCEDAALEQLRKNG